MPSIFKELFYYSANKSYDNVWMYDQATAFLTLYGLNTKTNIFLLSLSYLLYDKDCIKEDKGESFTWVYN